MGRYWGTKNGSISVFLKLYMSSKITYVSQPYQVGHRDRKSLAFIIPAKIVKKYNIDPSTIFAVRADQQTNSIVLKIVDLDDSSQQVLSE
jgi:heterodisulfide reductase subunit A-like polyferredoxin